LLTCCWLFVDFLLIYWMLWASVVKQNPELKSGQLFFQIWKSTIYNYLGEEKGSMIWIFIICHSNEVNPRFSTEFVNIQGWDYIATVQWLRMTQDIMGAMVKEYIGLFHCYFENISRCWPNFFFKSIL
jgi:hypothetical protein